MTPESITTRKSKNNGYLIKSSKKDKTILKKRDMNKTMQIKFTATPGLEEWSRMISTKESRICYRTWKTLIYKWLKTKSKNRNKKNSTSSTTSKMKYKPWKNMEESNSTFLEEALNLWSKAIEYSEKCDVCCVILRLLFSIMKTRQIYMNW